MVSSPLTSKLDNWKLLLDSDPDKDFIIHGLKNGFDIVNTNVELIFPAETPNSRSAEITYREKVEKQILQEISLGRYKIVDEKPTIISPIAAILKESNEIRIIHDCSQPDGSSLNSYATPDKHSFVSVDSAVQMTGKNFYMAKVDLKSAYRQVPISKFSTQFTGLKWKFKGDSQYTFLIDTALPFGASLSVGIFHRITQSVCRSLKKLGVNAIICYLDDFYITGERKKDVIRAMNCLISVLRSLGFSISWEKCICATQCLTFLGVTINTRQCTLSIPGEKMTSLRELLLYWSNLKNRASKREIQSLLGKLNWVARIVPVVRPAMRRLIGLMTSLRRQHHRLRITADTRRDIAFLHNLCSSFNGTCHFGLEYPVPDPAYIVTDSSTTAAGAALIYEQKAIDWLYCSWKLDMPEVKQQHINVKELTAVYLALNRWRSFCANRQIQIFTDNTATLWALRKGSIRNIQASDILCKIFLLCLRHNIKLLVNFIPTKENILADSISRLQDLSFATYALSHLPFINLRRHMSQKTLMLLFQEWSNRQNCWIWRSKS